MTAYRQYKESKVFARLKPFYKDLLFGMTFDKRYVTPTQHRLKGKFHYIFDVSMGTEKIPGIQHEMFSFLSDTNLTKGQAQAEMYRLIEEKEALEKYGKIQFLTVSLSGVRQSRWIK